MGAGAVVVPSVLEHTDWGQLLSRRKVSLFTTSSLFVCSHLERQSQQRNFHNACGVPIAFLDALTIAVALHTGILQCCLSDAKADGYGNTVSALSAPFLLGRFFVRSPPVTFCRNVEKSHIVPREQRLCSRILVCRIYFLLRE